MIKLGRAFFCINEMDRLRQSQCLCSSSKIPVTLVEVTEVLSLEVLALYVNEELVVIQAQFWKLADVLSGIDLGL